MEVIIHQVNAFTANYKGGNPAGVVIDADKLSESQMLDVAKAVGFSETAFISKSTTATRKLRFFTPTEEVDLCGHATIASWSYMHDQGILNDGEYTQDTKAGVLKVSVRDELVYMEQAKARLYETISRDEIAPVLSISKNSFHKFLEPQIVSTGLKDLIVPVIDEPVLARLAPDFEAMAKMSQKYDITGLHVFSLLEDEETLLIARNFAPLFGINNEEAATGTSNGATLCYLKEHNALPQKDEYRIEQGLTMNEQSYIYGQFKDGIVWIGGKATTIKQFTLEV